MNMKKILMFGGGILQKMYMEYGIPVYVYMTAEEFNMSNMMLAIQECINNKQR